MDQMICETSMYNIEQKMVIYSSGCSCYKNTWQEYFKDNVHRNDVHRNISLRSIVRKDFKCKYIYILGWSNIQCIAIRKYGPRHLIWLSQTYEKWVVIKERPVRANWATRLWVTPLPSKINVKKVENVKVCFQTQNFIWGDFKPQKWIPG